MSDEFIEIATKEINEEISEISTILSSCKSNADVFSSSDKFQKHTHKIKGLAPMMGKEELGNLAAILDSIMKKMKEGAKSDEIFTVLSDSVVLMQKSMTESDSDLTEIKNRASQILNVLS